MTTTREQIMAVLEHALDGLDDGNGNALKSVGRRLRDPAKVDVNDMPCLYLVGYLDEWETPKGEGGVDLPPLRTMTVMALLYLYAPTEDDIPDVQVNNFIEAIEGVFSPDDSDGGTFTLDGLARYCRLEGVGPRSTGDTTGRSVAGIPIKIGLYQ